MSFSFIAGKGRDLFEDIHIIYQVWNLIFNCIKPAVTVEIMVSCDLWQKGWLCRHTQSRCWILKPGKSDRVTALFRCAASKCSKSPKIANGQCWLVNCESIDDLVSAATFTARFTAQKRLKIPEKYKNLHSNAKSVHMVAHITVMAMYYLHHMLCPIPH